ncbi:MAG: hypothetical protein UX13_C0054G0001, partial [Candidatus Woesebacteria bacterium GW2011_GWB1_45_5]
MTKTKKEEESLKFAAHLHEGVPANWYYQSLKVDPFQKYWHKRRFEEVSAVLEPVKGKILDIGCADGMFSKVIFDKTKAKELIGMDVLASSINWAEKHWAKSKGMKFFVGDAHNLKFESGTFDAVVALEVLEHVENPVEVLKEIKRTLKKGGYGVFLVPSDNDLFKIVWFLWLHFYPRGWVWKD